MAVTKAQICNLALAHIKQTQSSISNLDTDTGVVAVQCRIHYDVCREFVLADHWWNFAKKRVTLTDIGTPPTTWLYHYDYPSDCLNFREVQRDIKTDLPIPFDIEDDGTETGLCIVTDKYQAVGVYTRDVTNVSLFTPGFIHSLSWFLASELAMAIPGDLKLQKSALTVYRASYGAAKAVNSNEASPEAELNSPWDRARESGES
jgi:hypothetical protein